MAILTNTKSITFTTMDDLTIGDLAAFIQGEDDNSELNVDVRYIDQRREVPQVTLTMDRMNR